MKKIAAILSVVLALIGCTSRADYQPIDNDNDSTKVETDTTAQKDTVVERVPDMNTDLCLIYDGNKARSYRWTENLLKKYVAFADEDGKLHWLFDGFLILDFRDTGASGSLEKTYASGYYAVNGPALNSANKSDWQYFIDRWLGEGGVCENLDKAVASVAQDLGGLPYKREVVIGIPEAITHENWSDDTTPTVYWGEIDGSELDFSKQKDKNKAIDWFIDQVIEKFNSSNYQNIRLVGFYSINESFSTCADSMKHTGKYAKQLDYSYYWIPYFKASGYDLWNLLGFTRAYMQPNYFFQQSANENQVEETCELAAKHKMYIEFECDDCVYSKNSSGEEGRRKFRKYMEGIKNSDCYDMPLAYYQSGRVFEIMQTSTNSDVKDLWYEFCHWMLDRKNRLTQ